MIAVHCVLLVYFITYELSVDNFFDGTNASLSQIQLMSNTGNCTKQLTSSAFQF